MIRRLTIIILATAGALGALAGVRTNSVSGTVTYRRQGDPYFFLRDDRGEYWRVGIKPPTDKKSPRIGDKVKAIGLVYEQTVNRRIEDGAVEVIGHGRRAKPTPEVMTLAELSRSPVGENPGPDHFARYVSVVAKVKDLNRRESVAQIVLTDGGSLLPIAVPYPLKKPLPEGLAVGAIVKVNGVYVYTTETDGKGRWIAISNPGLIVDGMEEFSVLSRPPFWTESRVYMLAVGLFAFAAAIFVWIIVLRRTVAKTAAKLEVTLREKVRERIEADIARRERLRLAHDLHDDFQQLLASTAFRLQAAKNLLPAATTSPEALEQLALAVKSVEHTQTGLRTVLWSMTEESEGPSGLASLFRYASGRMAHWDGVVDFEFEGEEKPLSRQFAGSLLMILQEAVGNAIRHGGADHVRVKVEFKAKSLAMTITDDGSGFEVKEMDASHLGLRGMRERAETLGGSFAIESAIGAGTKIGIEVPL